MIGGVVADQFGLAAPFWLYAVVCTIAAVIGWFIIEPPEQPAADKG